MKKNANLIMVFAAALALRAGYAVMSPARPAHWDDAASWRAVASNLAAGKGFLESDGSPTQQRPPVYPAFLAAIYLVLGDGRFWTTLFQAMVSALTIIPVFYVARSAFGDTVAKWSSWALALYPPLIVYVNIVGSETLFTFWLAASLALYCSARAGTSFVLWGAAGASFGVCSLTRSTSIPLPAFMIAAELIFALAFRRGFSGSISKEKTIAAGLFLVFYATVLTPWSVRNYAAFGRFSPMAAGAGGLFWAGTQKQFDGRAAESAMEHYYDEMKGKPFVEQDAFAFRLAVKTIARDPAGYASLTAKRFYRAMFVPVGGNLLAEKSPAAAFLLNVLHAVWILAALAGLAASFGMPAALPAASVFLYFIAVNTVLASIPRYRLPVETFIMVFFMYFVSRFFAGRFRTHNKTIGRREKKGR